MANPETLCPKCGFSPIPDRAEKCPKCGEVFSFNPLYKAAQRKMIGRKEDLDYEGTLLGGLTGEVSAYPGPAAAVLGVGAAGWLIRAAGLFVDLHEPAWLFGLAAAELLAATVLMANVGPAKLFAQLVAVAHIAVAFVLSDGRLFAPHTLFTAGVGVVVIGMTVGEPSSTRRYAGLGLGAAFAVGAVVSVVWLTAAPPPPPVVLVDARLGCQLVVPAGWSRMESGELAPHLPLPSDDGKTKWLGFGSRGERIRGLLLVSSEATVQLIGGCQQHLKRLGGVEGARPLEVPAPKALGKESLLFDLRAPSGANGRVGCGLVNNHFVALAVVAVDPTPGAGAAAFEMVGEGLQLP